MTSIKERLDKMKREAKERSRQLTGSTDGAPKDTSNSSGSGNSAMDSKMLITSACSQFNGTTTALAPSYIDSYAAIPDENFRPPSRIKLRRNAPPAVLRVRPNTSLILSAADPKCTTPAVLPPSSPYSQQRQLKNEVAPPASSSPHQLQHENVPRPSKSLNATKMCSSSCSNLRHLMPSMPKTPMATPAGSGPCVRMLGAGDAAAHPTPLSRMPKSVSSSNIVYSTKQDPVTEERQQKRVVIAGQSYTLLNQLGKGGSSVVYQAFSSAEMQCVAIKCVDLTNADEMVAEAYENEINLLASLQGSPYVIKMFTFEKRNNRLYVVMERGDIDLSTFMRKRSEQIDDKFIKYHWQEMLRCVKVIHDRNIVHSDLKPANFLFVGASLKLIDFGIASNIPSNKTSIVKDVQIGTLNYMSPEAINGFYDEDGAQHYKIPLKSDVWSLGCILYAMVYGGTPFHHLPNQIAKIQAISSDRILIKFAFIKDEMLLDVMKRCLVRNVKQRASVDELLAHPYLQS